MKREKGWKEEAIELLILILDLQEKCRAKAKFSKRDWAILRKAVGRFEKVTGIRLILEEERIEVEEAYVLIRRVKAIHDLPEFGRDDSGIHRLFGLVLKVFNFKKVSSASARNYYNRKEDE